MNGTNVKVIKYVIYLHVDVTGYNDVSLGFWALEFIWEFQEDLKFGTGFSMCTLQFWCRPSIQV